LLRKQTYLETTIRVKKKKKKASQFKIDLCGSFLWSSKKKKTKTDLSAFTIAGKPDPFYLG
jgi:hypothetical protein